MFLLEPRSKVQVKSKKEKIVDLVPEHKPISKLTSKWWILLNFQKGNIACIVPGDPVPICNINTHSNDGPDHKAEGY